MVHRNAGFTLIELIVGIGLGIVVLGGVLAVYVPTVQSWRATSALADIQDTEFVLHDVFSRAIRQAGALGCGSSNGSIIDGIDPGVSRLSDNINVWAFPDSSNASALASSFMQTPFKAFAANSTQIPTELSAGLQAKRLSNGNGPGASKIGDVFYSIAPSKGFYRIASSQIGPGAKQIDLTSNIVPGISIKNGSFYIVNDCDNPLIVMANADDPAGTLNYSNNRLNTVTHPPNTVVNEFQATIYYIGSFTPNGALASVPTLYQRTIELSGASFITVDQPIVTGVENLRIEYGLAMNSNGQKRNYVVRYVTIDQMPAGATFDDVRTIKVTLMIQSDQTGNFVRQSNLMFPGLGSSPTVLHDCSASNASNPPNACPASITTVNGQAKAHRIITFSFALPRV